MKLIILLMFQQVSDIGHTQAEVSITWCLVAMGVAVLGAGAGCMVPREMAAMGSAGPISIP
jgi:hypothetical protein